MEIANAVVEQETAPIEPLETEKPVIEIESAEKPAEELKGKEVEKDDKPKDEKESDEKRKDASWSSLAKKERAVELKSVEFKKEMETERAKFETEKKAHESDIKAAIELQNQVAAIQGDYGKLIDIMEKDLKIPLDDFLKFIVDGQTPEYTAKRLEEKFNKKFEDEKAESEKKAKELTEKQEKQIIDNHKKQISEFLSTNKDEYELIELNGAEDEVFKLIELTYNKTQKVLTIKEASDKVENFIHNRLKTSKKLSKAEQKAEDNKEVIEAKDTRPKQPLLSSGLKKRTLNNSNTAPSPTPEIKSAEKITGISGARLRRISKSN
jgi:hypothetical protein